ncbi:endonuclease-reverse transcriptase [Plakobranchus ocellatus]|uniref:Endonuclease-reverse transcriptase n=1 Tax=Plakobranchus ocellatus TaxID=259542 RepID=A0AAV3ZYP3_9GAST|nr:endonuclease-reverse transcriptase [Plakobranchus ocellatus]
MWFIKRMMRIPWTVKKSNEVILKEANLERSLMKTIRQRQLQFLGHICRHKCLEHLAITGKIEGKRSKEVAEATGISAIMSLLPILLLLGAVMISLTQGSNDLKIVPQRPPSSLSDKNPLAVKCVFNKAGSDISSVTTLKLERKKLGQSNYKFVASKVYSTVKNGLGPGPTVTAKLNQGGESFVNVKYSTPTDGYCYTYRCFVQGRTRTGRLNSDYATFTITSPHGLTCRQNPPKPPSNTEINSLQQCQWTKRCTEWQSQLGRRDWGRPQARWMDDIRRAVGAQWQRKAQDRREWKTSAEGYILQWMDKTFM